MTCPNCKNQIQSNAKFCKYCGESLSPLNSHQDQFGYSNTYSNTTNEYSDEHQDQFNYSNTYSNTTDDYSDEHKEQFNYSNTYSNTTNDYSDDHKEQFSYSQLYSDMLTPSITSDEDYIKAYVGKNYETIKEEKLSVPALILGPIYLLYRKMWLFALAIIFINYLLLVYCNQETTMIIQLLIHVYIGLKFNNIYMQNTLKKIDEIKMSNPDKSSTELLDICKKQGGVNTHYIIIGIIASLIGWGITYVQNPKQEDKTHDSIMTIANMNYQINEKAIISHDMDNYHYYSYTDNEINYCSFSISIDNYIKMYSNTNDYLKKTLDPTSKRTNIEFSQKTINNITWDFAQITNNNKIENNYAILKNNVIYIIKINHQDKNAETCTRMEKELIESISFNEK